MGVKEVDKIKGRSIYQRWVYIELPFLLLDKITDFSFYEQAYSRQTGFLKTEIRNAKSKPLASASVSWDSKQVFIMNIKYKIMREICEFSNTFTQKKKAKSNYRRYYNYMY